MNRLSPYLLVILTILLIATSSLAGPSATAIRETAEFIVGKFGKGAAGQSVEEIAAATANAVARHGDDALPLLRNSGHAGFSALKEAGENAPDVVRLYARRGDEALWVISEPKKLAIFIKHGDSAADALLKHPGIADNLIGRFGNDAVGALNSVSRQSAQRLSMLADEGVLNATKQSPELLSTIRKYGDVAMDFIWKNKGALTVTSVLVTFLTNPEVYISGAKDLIVDPIVNPIVKSVNWTLILIGVLVVAFLPYITRSFNKVWIASKKNK